MLPTAVSISRMIWNLEIDLITLQTQKKTVNNGKKGKSKKGKGNNYLRGTSNDRTMISE